MEIHPVRKRPRLRRAVQFLLDAEPFPPCLAQLAIPGDVTLMQGHRRALRRFALGRLDEVVRSAVSEHDSNLRMRDNEVSQSAGLDFTDLMLT